MALFKKKELVGLDIGSSAVKAVQLLRKSKKSPDFQLVALDMEELSPEAVVEDTIIDSGLVVDSIQGIFLRQKIKAEHAAVALSGNSVIIKKITMPEIDDVELAQSIQFEAEQYIPFAIDEVNLHYHRLHTTANPGDMDVILVAAKRDKISDYTSVVSQAGLVPEVVDVGVFALQNTFELNYPEEIDRTVCLINVGASLTNVAFLYQGESAFWRDISIAGDKYSEIIQKELHLAYEQADNLKKGYPIEGVSVESALPLINQISSKLAGEIQQSVEFFQDSYSGAQIEQIYFSGGGSKVAGLDKVLRERFDVPVTPLNPFQQIQYSTRQFDPEYINHYAPSFAISVGLALREAGES